MVQDQASHPFSVESQIEIDFVYARLVARADFGAVALTVVNHNLIVGVEQGRFLADQAGISPQDGFNPLPIPMPQVVTFQAGNYGKLVKGRNGKTVGERDAGNDHHRQDGDQDNADEGADNQPDDALADVVGGGLLHIRPQICTLCREW